MPAVANQSSWSAPAGEAARLPLPLDALLPVQILLLVLIRKLLERLLPLLLLPLVALLPVQIPLPRNALDRVQAGAALEAAELSVRQPWPRFVLCWRTRAPKSNS